MKTFEAIFLNGCRRNVSFQVRGICKFDVLNPCWNDRENDIPGRHWGGGKACEACTKAAAQAAIPPIASGVPFDGRKS